MFFGLVHGFPLPFFHTGPFRIKNLRKAYEIAFLFFALGALLSSRRREIFASLRKRWTVISEKPQAIWILVGVYFALFFWEQVTKVLSLEINFIPFLFYDYMLWYFDQLKFCYTGFLHGFYHVNLVLWLLYPFWKIFQSPWVLHVAHAFLAAFAVIPFFYWTRRHLAHSSAAFLAAFVYLNFRVVHNLVYVGFAVEVFYPLLIFSAVYFASKKKELFYYLSIFLGLLVKEDSAVYFGALGVYYLLSKGERKRGLVTCLASLVYPLLILKVFLPWTGSTILHGDVKNFASEGSGLAGIFRSHLLQPLSFLKEMITPFEKVESFFELNSRLLFLPVYSPWIGLVLAALAPLFLQGGEHFYSLDFYYGAPVLPFLFIAFVDACRRLSQKRWMKKYSSFSWGAGCLLLFLNGLNLQPLHFTREDLKTLQRAGSFLPEEVVVTQGHLLPYLSYRKENFYLSPHYEKNPSSQKAYLNPDFYYFDLEANPYPLDLEKLKNYVERLRKKRHYAVSYEDGRRIIFKRKP